MRIRGIGERRFGGVRGGLLVWGILWVGLLGFAGVPSASAETVAAAASLAPCMDRFAAEFKAATGMTVETTIGASGTLAKQIETGAPYGVFLSADENWARYLEKKGLIRDPRPFAECPLVLWGPGKTPPTLDSLRNGAFRVAVADPEAAPFGKAAQGYLQRVGLWDRLLAQKRLVIAKNVQAAALTAKEGAAGAAFLPRSSVKLLEGSWSVVPIPALPLWGGLVEGKAGEASRAFWAYLTGGKADGALRAAGLVPVRR